jgi:tyrosyl-tRNA synthetase
MQPTNKSRSEESKSIDLKKRKKFFVLKRKKRSKMSEVQSKSKSKSKSEIAYKHSVDDTNQYTCNPVDSSCVSFIDSLTDVEREVFQIAKDHLKSSFHIRRSNGYVEYVK